MVDKSGGSWPTALALSSAAGGLYGPSYDLAAATRPVFLRIANTGARVQTFISSDGSNYLQMSDTAFATVFTIAPDQAYWAGFHGGTPTALDSVTLVSWWEH